MARILREGHQDAGIQRAFAHEDAAFHAPEWLESEQENTTSPKRGEGKRGAMVSEETSFWVAGAARNVTIQSRFADTKKSPEWTLSIQAKMHEYF